MTPPNTVGLEQRHVIDLTDAALAGIAAPRPASDVPAPAPAIPAQRSLAHRAFRVLSGVVLALLAIAAVTGAVLVVTLKLSFAPVLSPSMEPAFGPGDLIVTKPLAASAVAPGDVVILPIPDAPGQRYVHRVIEVTSKDGLPVVRTQGDNNPTADEWALRIDSPTVPSVVASVPDAGRLALLTQGAGLRIALMVVVAGLVLVGTKRALLD